MMETGRRIQVGRQTRLANRERGRYPGRGTPTVRPQRQPTRLRKAAAWAVHAYTAMGLVVAGAMAALLVRGDASAFQGCFALMVLATLIDATDGTFARAVDVKRVVPGFDGRRLDDITDFLTYTFIPLMLIWRAGLLPAGTEAWLAVPLLASAYGFCQVSIKTDDGFFLGFPSLWNVVAFYLYALQLPGNVALGILVVLGLMTFVPSKYLYPSQPGRLNRWSTILGAVWTAPLLYVIWQMGDLRAPGLNLAKGLLWVSVLYPIYYFAASWIVTFQHWRRPRPAPAA